MKTRKIRKTRFYYEFINSIGRWDKGFKTILFSPIPSLGFTYSMRIESPSIKSHNFGIELVFLIFRVRARVSIYVKRSK